MTDEPDDIHADPDAEAVRRLLADARHTGPMPDDVAHRMDAVLADLAGDGPAGSEAPAAAPEPAPIHPVVASLAAQRRRRAAGILVAAAVIVVGGVVAAQHMPGSGSQEGASATAGGDRAESDSSLGNTDGRQPVSPGASTLDEKGTAAKIRGGRLLVRPQHFTTDALAARRVLERKAPASAYASLSRPESSCVVSRTRGQQVRATYERAPAVLVFRAPGSDFQVVDLYLCGSGRPVRSVTLPIP